MSMRGHMIHKRKKRKCMFCMTKKEPYFLDVETIEGFVGENRRILPRRATGTCSKHQRGVTRAVKRARFVALLPYVPGQ